MQALIPAPYQHIVKHSYFATTYTLNARVLAALVGQGLGVTFYVLLPSIKRFNALEDKRKGIYKGKPQFAFVFAPRLFAFA